MAAVLELDAALAMGAGTESIEETGCAPAVKQRPAIEEI
jgi:hypothetical protein